MSSLLSDTFKLHLIVVLIVKISLKYKCKIIYVISVLKLSNILKPLLKLLLTILFISEVYVWCFEHIYSPKEWTDSSDSKSTKISSTYLL